MTSKRKDHDMLVDILAQTMLAGRKPLYEKLMDAWLNAESDYAREQAALALARYHKGS